MGSKCGNLKHVPFQESWPPAENNLGGPYWERRLAGKGIHHPAYKLAHGVSSSASAARPPSAVAAKGLRVAGNSARGSLPGVSMAAVCLTVFLCFCVLGVAHCVSGAGNRGAGRWSKRSLGPRKPRGRSKALTRSNLRVDPGGGAKSDV